MISNTTIRDNRYFATLEGEELLEALSARIDEYYRFLESSGRMRKLRLNYQHYYGNDGMHNANEVQQGGEQGELELVKVNKFRNLIQHLLVMTTNQRPTIDCKAVNTDADSTDQAILGNGVLEYYLKQEKIEDALIKSTEIALVLEEGYIAFEWDITKGQEQAVDPQSGQAVKNGDIAATVLTPLEHIINPYAKSPDHQWRILKLCKNRYDLIAQYPELKDKILSLANEDVSNQYYYLSSRPLMDNDNVNTYMFYHEKTPAVPNGRLVYFSADCQFYDVPLPYDGVPVERVSPADQFYTPFGYSVATDLGSLQQLKDAMYSILATNNIRFGTQSIVAPKGADFKVQQLGRGMTLFELDPQYVDMLKPIQFTKSAPEAYTFEGNINSEMGSLAGVDMVTQGNVDRDMSGSAMALLQSMSVQFNAGLVKSYSQLIERSGLRIIKMLQRYAQTPRVVSIVGVNNFDKIKNFIGDDLSLVTKVTCGVGNPMSRTLGGRQQMAESLLQKGLITRPDEYMNLLETGKWEPLIDDQARQVQTSQAEREALLEGQPVQALISDDPRIHVPDHMAILNSPEARSNPQLVQAVLSHVQEHLNLWRGADPAVLMLLGIPPAPPPPIPPMPQPSQGPQAAPGQHGAPPPNHPPQPAGPAPGNPPPSTAAQKAGVNMPNAPKPAQPPPGAVINHK